MFMMNSSTYRAWEEENVGGVGSEEKQKLQSLPVLQCCTGMSS